jgi:hypothetical protein
MQAEARTHTQTDGRIDGKTNREYKIKYRDNKKSDDVQLKIIN